MRRIVQQHPTLAARSLPRFVVAALVALLLAASAADAALTTGKCLGQKRTAWITLRKCQGVEQVKLLNGKPTDLAKCQTKFQDALAKITAKAAKAGIACRYLDNSDSTITDFDTGLQWEKLTEDGSLLDKDITFTWGNLSGCPFPGCPNGTAFIELLGRFNNCVLTAGASVGGFAGHCDWRLPTLIELEAIKDFKEGVCSGASGACIDPIFGPTAAGFYWSATTNEIFPTAAWIFPFVDQPLSFDGKNTKLHVRAVRADL